MQYIYSLLNCQIWRYIYTKKKVILVTVLVNHQNRHICTHGRVAPFAKAIVPSEDHLETFQASGDADWKTDRLVGFMKVGQPGFRQF